MHKLLYNYLRQSVRRKLGMTTSVLVSPYRIAREFLNFKTTVIYWFRSAVLVTIGILSAGFGLKSFLLPNHFIDGGITGISLMVNATSGASLAFLLVAFNAPFIVLGYQQFGPSLALKSTLAILGLAMAVAFIEYPVVTSDKLLVASFGGVFLGLGIGLSIRGGAVIDGTEVLAIYIGRRTGLSIGDVILIFNLMIFLTAAYVLSPEAAMYSMLTYVAAAKTVDFVVEGIEEYIGVTIISTHQEEIKTMIASQMRRGVTVYAGKGGIGKSNRISKNIDILFSVVTRLELSKLKVEIAKIDPNAFIVLSKISDVKGGIVKKRPLK